MGTSEPQNVEKVQGSAAYTWDNNNNNNNNNNIHNINTKSRK